MPVKSGGRGRGEDEAAGVSATMTRQRDDRRIPPLSLRGEGPRAPTRTVLVDLGGVGVHVVRGDHAPGPQHLGALVVPVPALAAHVHHGVDAIGVPHDAGGGIEGLGPGQVLDGLVNVARPDGEDLDGVFAGQEAGHVEVVHGHVVEDAAAPLDVVVGRRGGVARAGLDLGGRGRGPERGGGSDTR